MTTNRPPNTKEHPDRLVIDIARNESVYANLAEDIRVGMTQSPKSIPTKYLYDSRGSELFDTICDLPEYYPTRTEQGLLEAVAGEIVARSQPTSVVELGSGASRKTRVLLDAFSRSGELPRYVPMDVSESMLRSAAEGLLDEYSDLEIHGVIGDYHRDLEHLPTADRKLVVFLGSTIGNFPPTTMSAFLTDVREQLDSGEYLLLGADLVKSVPVLEAAYNDEAGVTAEFNRNVLNVLNRELDAEFETDSFEHVAFFNRDASQIELSLRATDSCRVPIRALDMEVEFAAGEEIRTEISRKFTYDGIRDNLLQCGYDIDAWYSPANRYFGLALARAV